MGNSFTFGFVQISSVFLETRQYVVICYENVMQNQPQTVLAHLDNWNTCVHSKHVCARDCFEKAIGKLTNFCPGYLPLLLPKENKCLFII